MKLGSVADYFGGVTFSPEDKVPLDADDAVVCMRTKNIQTTLDESDLIAIRASLVKRDELFLCPGDILVSSANSWNLVAKCCYVPKLSYPATAGGFIAVLRARKTTDPRYLYYWLSWDRTQAAARACARQTTNIANLSRERFLALDLPLPSLAEQRRIAAILDKADAIRRKRQEAIALTEQLLRSTFLEMFGGPERHYWEMTTVAGLAEGRPGAIRTGPFGSQLLHSEFVDSGIAVLGIDNAVSNEFRWGKPRFITEKKYESLRRYTVNPGDVIITIMGTCGRCAVVPDDIPQAINTKHLCCITLDRSKCLPDFLHSYFLFHPGARRYLERTAKGAIMEGLNMGIISQLPVPVVPMSLQRRYQAFAQTLAKTKRGLHEQARNADALFNSLTQRAFSGQL